VRAQVFRNGKYRQRRAADYRRVMWVAAAQATVLVFATLAVAVLGHDVSAFFASPLISGDHATTPHNIIAGTTSSTACQSKSRHGCGNARPLADVPRRIRVPNGGS
jgi:hypothetical protein